MISGITDCALHQTKDLFSVLSDTHNQTGRYKLFMRIFQIVTTAPQSLCAKTRFLAVSLLARRAPKIAVPTVRLRLGPVPPIS